MNDIVRPVKEHYLISAEQGLRKSSDGINTPKPRIIAITWVKAKAPISVAFGKTSKNTTYTIVPMPIPVGKT